MLTELPFIEIVRQKDAGKAFNMLVRRSLGPNVSQLGRDGGVPHVHTLLVLSIFDHRCRLSEQWLCPVCSATIHIDAMALLIVRAL